MGDFTVEPIKQNTLDNKPDTIEKNIPPQFPLAGVPTVPSNNTQLTEPIPGVTVTDEHGNRQFIPLPGIPVIDPKFRDNLVKPKKPPTR
jgi:hypothetical protein